MNGRAAIRISTYWFLLLGVPFLSPSGSSGLKIAVRHGMKAFGANGLNTATRTVVGQNIEI